MKLRCHLSAATKHTGDTHLLERYFFTQRFEQFRRRKQATNTVMRFQQSKTLLDDVLLVLLGHLRLAHLDQLNDPAWIEIDEETDPATMLREMFDCQTQTTRTSWSKRN